MLAPPEGLGPLPTGNPRSAPDIDSCNNAKLSFFTYTVKLFSGLFHLTFTARIQSKPSLKSRQVSSKIEKHIEEIETIAIRHEIVNS